MNEWVRLATPGEQGLDAVHRSECCWHQRLVMRLFRRQINHVAKTALCRAHERNQINSIQMHAVAGIIDRILWPERFEEQAHNIRIDLTDSK